MGQARWAAVAATVGIATLLPGCRSRDDQINDALRKQQREEDARAETHQASPPNYAHLPEPPPSQGPRGCDADAIWTGDDQAKAFDATVRGWTPECRRTAMAALCGDGCDDVVSTHVIAAAGPEESASLRTYRLERNGTALSASRELFGRANALFQYAIATGATARTLSPECMRRLRTDFDRIEALSRETTTALGKMKGSGHATRTGLAMAKSCVNCSEDTSDCDPAEIREQIKIVQENFRDDEKLIALDRRKLASAPKAARLARPLPASCVEAPHLGGRHPNAVEESAT